MEPQYDFHPRMNRLLAQLGEDCLESLLPYLEITAIRSKELIYEPDKQIDTLYFPLNGIISILAFAGDSEMEVAEVGNEGMIGIHVFLGSDISPTRWVSQTTGHSVLMRMETFLDLVNANPTFQNAMRHYTLARFNQISQLAVCNGLHTMKQRFARWLLMTQDRMSCDEFPLTQELISQMLGVRRATATIAAQSFQKGGLISYNRGIMKIIDRSGLIETACTCYGTIVENFERLVPAR